MTPFFAAAVDPIVTFVIIVVASVVISFLKNKGMIKGLDQERSDEPGKPASPPAPRRPTATPTQAPRPAATSWEAELRRLLEGENPPARPPTAPRPVVVAQPASPVPPPLVRPAARPVIKPVIVATVPTIVPKAAPVQAPVPVASSVETSARGLASMQESKLAYEKASQLGQTVAAHIDRVPGQRVAATGVVRRTASPEVAQVVSMFKNARTVRQAVIASIILSPPGGLEPVSGIF